MLKSLSFSSVLLMVFLYCLSAGAGANDFLASPSVNFSPKTVVSASLSQDDEFLPVDKAFQLSYYLEGGQLILEWDIADTYYLYQERFDFTASDGSGLTPLYSGSIEKYDELFERETTVHYGHVRVALDGLPSTPITLAVEYQGCADAGLCYPPQTVHLSVDAASNHVALGQSTPAPAAASTVEPTTTTTLFMWQALLFAFLGGVILNLMPCVFPVLSIKVMSLTQAAPGHLAIHGWMYTLGILVCFVGFSLLLLAARAGGEAIGWGFQLQNPLLIGGLAYLFFVMALSMSGAIELGSSLMGAGQSLTQQSGLGGSFFTGVLAAVVASPCTAPFMGAALGYALTQPAFSSIAVFVALGLGMAFPLLLLCFIPSLAERLPRPGAWMDTLKQFLAFPLYASAIWLAWVYGRQTQVSGMALLLLGMLSIGFALWLGSRQSQGVLRWITRALAFFSLIAALAILGQTPTSPADNPASDRWQPYSAATLTQLRTANKPVFINLTADWCITCLANERIALHTDKVEQLFDEKGVVTLKGDWTNADPLITQLLNEYGRNGVPLYLWFPAGHTGNAILLPQLLTPDIIAKYINQ
jgi:thiol:disulfide interchange protein